MSTERIIPENDMQELWELNGKVNSLHKWLLEEQKKDVKSTYYSSMDSTIHAVACILGFDDVLAIDKEGGE